MKMTIDSKISGIVIFNPCVRKKLLKVFRQINCCNNLAELPYNKIHSLKGKRYGELSLPVTADVRILFIPNEYPADCFNILNKCNESKITGIEIVGITFNHYEKIKTKK